MEEQNIIQVSINQTIPSIIGMLCFPLTLFYSQYNLIKNIYIVMTLWRTKTNFISPEPRQ